jgi:predicted PilT family ATPase
VDSAIAVAERPALGEVVSQEMDQDVVQKIDSRQAISRPRMSERMEVAPTDAGSAEEPDIEDLARKVYARLKTKLRIERERSRGRF